MSNTLTNDEKCTYCREYGNLPCEKCDEKLKSKTAMEQPKKYIKVAVSERKPKKQGVYFVLANGKTGLRLLEEGKSLFYGVGQPDFWLEEVPDRESELIEMLDKCKEKLKYDSSGITLKIDSLIQSVKQPK